MSPSALTRSTYVADRLVNIEDALAAGDWPAAVQANNEAASAAPSDPHVLHASGRLCELADQPDDALAQWIHALSIDPKIGPSWSAIGTLLSRGVPLNNPHQIALLAFAQAHRADPEWLLPAWHMALLYHALGYPDAAAMALQRCGNLLKAHGNSPKNLGTVNIHNRAYMHLTLGHWEQGYACYEHRLNDVGHRLSPRAQSRPPKGVPQWTEGPPPAKLAVFVEQGAGDMFMVLQYVKQLVEMNVTVVLETFPSMTRVLGERLELDGVQLIEQDELLAEPVDAYVWAMSLPGLMYAHDQSQGVARLPTNTLLKRNWRRDQLYVAFCWQGSRTHKSDRIRSMPVEALRGLAQHVRSLGCLPIALNPGEPIPEFLESPMAIDDFEGTASVLDQCSAVVSVDTALVHLAGSMGVPTYACLSALPDWRWGLVGRGLRIWYDSVTLVRQPTIGDWKSVTDIVRDKLSEQLITAAGCTE